MLHRYSVASVGDFDSHAERADRTPLETVLLRSIALAEVGSNLD